MLNILMENPFLLRALIGVVLTSFSAATMGTFIVLRGISFLTAEVAHAALAGVALAIFLQSIGILPSWNPFIIAIIFALGTATLTGYASERGQIHTMEAAIGVAFAISMALAVTLMGLVPSERLPEIWGYLIGDILLLTYNDLIMLTITTIIITVITTLLLKEFLYISFDIEGAEAMGINTNRYNYLMLIVAALAIVIETKTVGSILVYTYMILPAAIISKMNKNITQIMSYSLILSILTGLAGIWLSLITDLPPSGIIGIILSTAYMIINIFKKKEQ